MQHMARGGQYNPRGECRVTAGNGNNVEAIVRVKLRCEVGRVGVVAEDDVRLVPLHLGLGKQTAPKTAR